MAIATAADLIDALKQGRLLDPAHLDEVSRDLQPRFPDPRVLARELMQRGWLTPYQVNQLLQGQASNLVLGPYVLLERIGEGGVGQVFKARHQYMQRFVAIKVIRKDLLTDDEIVRRFYREIQAAGQLLHPNVILAYDAGPAGATHFFAMEYVQGTDLYKMVKDAGPLPAPQACDYIRQAALGLQHAHERGMVHRDIKPSNLLVTQTSSTGDGSGVNYRWGLVKILDMGLARLQETVTGQLLDPLTQAGAGMRGTADYMAPEQAIDFHKADIRADIYSLGCTFFYLLTGQPPFADGTLAQKLMKHQRADPPSIVSVKADLPRRLDPIVKRMLAKKPEDRYQTPAEVATALASLKQGSGSWILSWASLKGRLKK
jgi:serine/threonine-protein kinase